MGPEGDSLGDPQPNKVPFGIERHLDFIDISEGGCLLLGTSNLTGKYWNGSIFYYKDPDLAPLDGKWVTGHSCENGVSAGKFLNSEEKVIVGEDSGTLSILSLVQLETEGVHFVPQMYASHHDDAITSIDVVKNTEQAISAGSDLCINVWDTESLTAIHRYCPAHARSVTSVAACNCDNVSLFASTSLDGVILLWDTRMAKPAQVVKEDEKCGLTSLCWTEGGGKLLTAGSQTGHIFTLDIRSPADPLSSLRVFKRPLHALAPNHKTGLVAMCADAPNVIVWEPTSNTLVESDVKHTGFVRGLSWHPNASEHLLYSCGMDRKVLKHTNILCSSFAST